MLKEVIKKQDQYKYKNKEGKTTGNLILEVLPELINRNTKLSNRVKSKIKVSSLLNNIELRNQNYLKELVSSSDRTVQDLKSGLELSKAMKLSSDKLSLLNSKILNDCFMKKNHIIINTKKNLNKNTEEETNMIIKKSINTLRNLINPANKKEEEPIIEENQKKHLSQSDLNTAKNIIGIKISEEEKILKERIKNYLEKVKTIHLTNIKSNDLYDYKIQKLNKDKNRDFYLYAKHFSLDHNDMEMIHYKKLLPPPIRDRSCPNLENIKESLFPNIRTGQINSENYVNINNSNGIKIINGMKYYSKYGDKRKSIMQEKNENKNNYSEIIVNNKNDSFNILKKIIIRNRSLIAKSSNKYSTLSSLLDIQLPKISDYELILKNKKKIIEEEKTKNNEINNNEEKIIKNNQKQNSLGHNLYEKSELMKEFNALKDEIKILKEKKIDIEENYLRHQEELSNLVYIFEKNKNKNKKEEKDNLISGDGLINKKIFADNPRMRMPSSHSVSLIKRKFNINSGIMKNKYNNKIYRNYSNHTRDRTSASSIKNSASSIFTTRKNDYQLKNLFNYLQDEQKPNMLTNSLDNIPLLFSLPQEKIYNNSKNNINSSNITSLSDY